MSFSDEEIASIARREREYDRIKQDIAAQPHVWEQAALAEWYARQTDDYYLWSLAVTFSKMIESLDEEGVVRPSLSHSNAVAPDAGTPKVTSATVS